MAMMLIPSRPSAENVRPAIPGIPCMFSPTTATTAMRELEETCSTVCSAISGAKASRRASTVRFSSEEEITKQMSFCEEDCETKSTLVRSAAVAANDLASTSGSPTIPGPPTVMSVTPRIAVSALTPPLELPRAVIFVPGFSGAKLLRIHTGTPAAVTGRSVLGCSTLAPK